MKSLPGKARRKNLLLLVLGQLLDQMDYLKHLVLRRAHTTASRIDQYNEFELQPEVALANRIYVFFQNMLV